MHKLFFTIDFVGHRTRKTGYFNTELLTHFFTKKFPKLQEKFRVKKSKNFC